jgi:hypothetical protein
MPRTRKTNRGPKETATVAPFTFTTMHALLRGKVIKVEKNRSAISLDDPAVAHLTHVANFLQWKVRAIPHKENFNMATYLRTWSAWVDTGIMPRQRYGCIEPAGLVERQRWNMLDTAAGQHGVDKKALAALTEREPVVLAARMHALNLVCGVVRGDGRDSPYCIWLAEMKKPSLLARPIEQWKDYAPDLRKIFHTELRPAPGDSAAFRFIELTAPTITGETTTFGAVRTELLRGCWQKR